MHTHSLQLKSSHLRTVTVTAVFALRPVLYPGVHRQNEHPFNGPFSGTTRVSQYQKGKTNLDFTEARDSEWQWHHLGHMQVCISLQADNHASTPPLSFLQAGCLFGCPTNSVKALSIGRLEQKCLQLETKSCGRQQQLQFCRQSEQIEKMISVALHCSLQNMLIRLLTTVLI